MIYDIHIRALIYHVPLFEMICYVLSCYFMLCYDMFVHDTVYDNRCIYMFECLVKPASKTLMFGATEPNIEFSIQFAIINFQKKKPKDFRFQHCIEGTLFVFFCWLKVFFSTWQPNCFRAMAGWGFTWVPWFFMLSGFVLFSAYLKNPKDGGFMTGES